MYEEELFVLSVVLKKRFVEVVQNWVSYPKKE